MICAVVVTRDRLALLQHCVDAIRAQTRAPDRILVVDNASSDGTPAWLAAQRDVEVLRLEENGGSSGGFGAGLRHAHAAGGHYSRRRP